MTDTPAGWYPDPEDSGQQRYWDGAQWTEHRAPAAPAGPQTGTPAPSGQHAGVSRPATSRPWYKKKRFVIPIGAFVLLILFAGIASGGENATSPTAGAATSSSTSASSSSTSSSTSSTTTTPSKTTATQSMTKAQEQAVGSAKDYLSYQSFSRKGLIEQLKYDGFSTKDATFAVDHIKVNWKEQAAKSAKDYLSYQHFSRKGLIEQLEYDGYTKTQAQYGATKAGL